MRTNFPICQGLKGLVYLCLVPRPLSSVLKSRDRYAGPLSVMTRSTATPSSSKNSKSI